jgi:hypothetical protein
MEVRSTIKNGDFSKTIGNLTKNNLGSNQESAIEPTNPNAQNQSTFKKLLSLPKTFLWDTLSNISLRHSGKTFLQATLVGRFCKTFLSCTFNRHFCKMLLLQTCCSQLFGDTLPRDSSAKLLKDTVLLLWNCATRPSSWTLYETLLPALLARPSCRTSWEHKSWHHPCNFTKECACQSVRISSLLPCHCVKKKNVPSTAPAIQKTMTFSEWTAIAMQFVLRHCSLSGTNTNENPWPNKTFGFVPQRDRRIFLTTINNLIMGNFGAPPPKVADLKVFGWASLTHASIGTAKAGSTDLL